MCVKNRWVEVVVPVWLLLMWKFSGRHAFLPCVTTDISNAVSELSRGTTKSEMFPNRPLVQNAGVLVLQLGPPQNLSKVELGHVK